eukprot:gene1737-2462_t
MAGTLALGLHTSGVLGRLFAEAMENVPAGPGAALRAQGVGPLRVFAYATLPQVLPQLMSYTLYRWENNIRAAAVLGVVGADAQDGHGAHRHAAAGGAGGPGQLRLAARVDALVSRSGARSGAGTSWRSSSQKSPCTASASKAAGTAPASMRSLSFTARPATM